MLLLCALAAATAPRRARALDFTLRGREFTLDLTDTLGYTYAFDNDHQTYDPRNPVDELRRLEKLSDDKFHAIFNKLDVSLAYGEYRVGGRFDLYLFADTPFVQHCGGPTEPSWCKTSSSRYENQFVAERLYLLVTRPEFDLTLGDSYASFGKGLALSVIQLDEVGQDTTVQGGKMVIHHRDLGVTFLAGTFNVLDVDKTTGFRAPWRAEPVVAGRVEYNILQTVLAGTHAVYVIRDDQTGISHGQTDTIWGIGLDAPDLLKGALSLSGEFDLQHTVDDGVVVRGPGRETGDVDGLAGYGAATLQLWKLTLLTELKYYDEFELIGFGEQPYRQMYHLPPTLDRKKAEIKEGNRSVSGVRGRVDYAAGEVGPLDLLLFASYGYFESWQDKGDLQVHSAFGGLEVSWAEQTGQLIANSGVRRLFDRNADELYHQDIHLEVSIEQAFGSHSLELSTLLLARTTQRVQREDWREVELSLTYKWSPHFTVALTYERQEDPALVPREPRDPSSEQVPVPLDLFGGSVRYYFTTGSYVNVRVGENRAGIKCLNGICRQVPAFSGVEATLVFRL